MPDDEGVPTFGRSRAVRPGQRPTPAMLDFGEPPPAWYADALCPETDPEMFFPEKGGSTRDAKRICRCCPVARDCLDYALANGERHGIWGGHSERERRAMHRRIA